ncbi:MAG: 6-phospho-beta-glucosidase [Clostridia bacterium]|nr:6-phospho-beta-glucosidase [Clostridia bacterium]
MSRDNIKLAVIGGGSSYTPELIEGIIDHMETFPVGQIALVDIPAGQEKMEIIADLARRMLARAGLAERVEVQATLDRQAALEGADYIITQFRVGGLQARARDERIPLQYDVVGQETTGPGGFAKALRTIPVALEIAREVEAICPQAWIINFTNPSGIITEAISRYSNAKVIGLCNVPLSLKKALAALLSVDEERLDLDFVGLNHLSWARRISLDGRDITRQVLEKPEFIGMAVQNIPGGEWVKEAVLSLGMIPSPYLRYYYFSREAVAEEKEEVASGKGTRAEQVMAVEKELFELYRDPDLASKPPQLSFRGGAWYSEAAVSLLDALHNNRREVHVVNVPNRGAITDLPDEAVVEVNCLVDAQGARPLACGQLPLAVRGLVQQVKAYEQLTVQAAAKGSPQLAYLALLNHPLVPGARVAQSLWQDIWRENAQFLPQFDKYRSAP